jgi:hypothetical protein
MSLIIGIESIGNRVTAPILLVCSTMLTGCGGQISCPVQVRPSSGIGREASRSQAPNLSRLSLLPKQRLNGKRSRSSAPTTQTGNKRLRSCTVHSGGQSTYSAVKQSVCFIFIHSYIHSYILREMFSSL